VLVVVGQLDLGCVEEVEGSPLFCRGRELAASMEGLRGEREDQADRGKGRGKWEGGEPLAPWLHLCRRIGVYLRTTRLRGCDVGGVWELGGC
jgi:hypothetical protein